jgi:hypothetical protein
MITVNTRCCIVAQDGIPRDGYKQEVRNWGIVKIKYYYRSSPSVVSSIPLAAFHPLYPVSRPQ